MSRKSLDDWKNFIEMVNKDEESIDTYSNDYLICPYCGEKNSEYGNLSDVFFVEGKHEGVYCDKCSEDYIVYTQPSYSYETIKRKVEE